MKLAIRLASYLSFASTAFHRPLVNSISELLFDLFRSQLQQVNSCSEPAPFAARDRPPGAVDSALSDQHEDRLAGRPTRVAGDHSNGDPPDGEPRQSAPKTGLSSLQTENRHYLVIDQAHVLVADFCVQSLRAITGTLFHFWVIKVVLWS